MAGKKEKERAEEKKEKGRGRDNEMKDEKKNNSIKCINKRKMKITKWNEKF